MRIALPRFVSNCSTPTTNPPRSSPTWECRATRQFGAPMAPSLRTFIPRERSRWRHRNFSSKAKHPDASQRVATRSEEHTSELQSRGHLVCRLLLEKKNTRRPPRIVARPVITAPPPTVTKFGPLNDPISPQFFFFTDTTTTEIYTLSLHDALPISRHGTPQTLGYYILHEGLIGVFGDKGL